MAENIQTILNYKLENAILIIFMIFKIQFDKFH